MEQEQKHFDECCKIIRQNITDYEEKARQGKAETEALYAAVTSGDVELYNQLIVSRDIQEHNERQLKKNKAAFLKPYFGRIDYREEETKQEEQLYIGKNGVSRDKTEVVIVDWRAPVSALYYENELGCGSYQVPEAGAIPVELMLKRTFDVSDGKLLGYYDNDTAATDELLVKYLSQNKDMILGDIISTIQKEQNEIIRQSPFRNLIVQGVAGSGKTTVAMHRISYILYNYGNRFTPDEFCIIGSSDMLLGYITSGLPELDVYHVGQKRMDSFFQDLLGKEWKKKYKIHELDEKEAFKSKVLFIQELDCYLGRIREELLGNISVTDKALGTILSKESIQRTLQENPNASIAQLYKLLNERIRTRIQFLVSQDSPEYLREKKKEYRGYFTQTPGQKQIKEIYQAFLAEYGDVHKVSVEEVLAHTEKGKFDVYDMAALALIQKRVTEKQMHEEYGQIIIDEAQDFGAAVYYVLHKVLHSCYFTIMGDVSQNIHYETGMNDWEDMRTQIFNEERTSFHILAKSYRNTIEISKLAGHVLEQAAFGRYKIQPVIRHGAPVAFHETGKGKMAGKAAALIEEIKGRGYGTIAVICRNEDEARMVEQELDCQGSMVLPISLTKGLEFDGVILWNPDREAYTESQGDAKLLYVAITRALHELHILYEEELTGLLG